jgi:hypothetical protein
MEESSAPLPEEEAGMAALKAELAAELAAEPWAGFPELTGDVRLLRFLRSREGDAAEAAKAFRAHLAWRKENGVDAIRQRVVDEQLGLDWARYPRGAEVNRHFRMIIHGGFTLGGHLVQLDNMGLVNPEGIAGTQEGALGLEAFTTAFIYMLEARNKLQDDLSRESGRMIRTYQVRDLEQTGMALASSANMTLAKKVVALSQDNYPESMAQIVFINAGKVFSVVMAAMKGVLAARTLARFVVLKEDCEAELLKDMDISSVQQLYMLAGDARTKVAGHPNVSGGGGELSVPARWHADAAVAVQPGQTARWSWTVAQYDVGFHADILSDGGDGGASGWQWQAVPIGATETGAPQAAGDLITDGVTVTGSYTAAEAVVLRLRWDNAHAWTTTKAVTYSLSLSLAGEVPTEPEPEAAEDPAAESQ